MADNCEGFSKSFLNASRWVLITNNPKSIKKIKVFLEERDLYDKTRLITKLEQNGCQENDSYAIPVLPNYLLKEDQNLAPILKNCQLLECNEESPYTRHNTRNTTVIDTLVTMIRRLIGEVKEAIHIDDTLTEKFMEHLYTLKFYRHGDLVVLTNNNKDYAPLWLMLQKEVPTLWTQISQGLQCTRIALQDAVLPDGFRTPNIEMVLGDNGWVEHIDNEITYVFDVTRSMFSQGNISEKIRMGSLDCNGETIVDLYAGIGYFTLPLLVHGNAKCVHACEWNQVAVEGLKRGLVANGIEEGKCIIHFGDNREVAPLGIGADRILLGLIPSSEDGWPIACMCLNREKGGWIHVHGNVSSKSDGSDDPTTHRGSNEEDRNVSNTASFTKRKILWSRWAENVAVKFKSLLENIHQSDSSYSDSSFCSPDSNHISNVDWSVIIRHIEHVKSYAPHIDHLVVDLECRLM